VKRALATMLFLFFPALLPAQLSPNRGGRSVVMATHGMIAASHPLAAQVGLDILKKGGNAIDAAIAVNAALGVMEPMMCGVGGDLYALVWDAKTQKLYGLNASGRSPYKATLALFKEKGVKEIQSPLNWSVPGCVDGWEELRKRFGTMSFPQLLEPSIRYAEEGVPVPESIAWFWQWQPPEGEVQPPHPDFAKTFLPNGKAPQTGDVFKNPYLAGTYRTIAEGGRDAFYRGRIAQGIVAFSDQVGGLFTLKDFADHTSSWVEPVSTNYRGHDVWEIPPPGQGISVLEMLNILEGYDLGKMGRESADFWHLFIEAKKLAYADRARFYADPEFTQVPTAELISKSYAESQRKRVDMKRAAVDVEPGAPELGNHTTYFCVVDKDRNCVSLIQSVADLFGSKLVPGNLGFALHDRGAAFSLDPSHANHLEPHKRPFHTIIPAMVTKGGKPWLVFGVMGGWRQPQDQVQVLCNLIDFGMNVQEAGEAPRMEHLLTAASWEMSRRRQRSATVVAVESRFPASLLQELTRRGHEFIFIPFSEGGYQGILIDPTTGVLQGGSEARRDGAAVGY
jgi:gamma-glutamyltranspeptidase / glutathione hydrolase